jgi:hypothetical protein
MERACLACHNPLTGQQRKWCCNACAQRAASNAERGKPLDARSWIPSTNCTKCGNQIIGRGAQSKYCSARCKLDTDHERHRNRARNQRRIKGLPVRGEIVPCSNPQCFNAAVYQNGRAFCSDTCQQYFHRNQHWLGDGPSSRIWLYKCPDCSTDVLHRSQNGTPKFCSTCRLVRNQGINGRKNHARRAGGPPTLSVHEIAERDGTRCHICRRKVNMSLSGLAKWGPTIEHILPVSRGGTNDPSNLALAHRHCNTARGNRGHSQLVLVA